MKYSVHFTGKRKGAEGIYYPILKEVESSGSAQAVLQLYDDFDILEVQEIVDMHDDDKADAKEHIACDHTIGYIHVYDNIELIVKSEKTKADYRFKFCPDCGEKLEVKENA